MKKTAIIVMLLCSGYMLDAQKIYSTYYTMNDGLSSNRVYSIIQDRKGFLWFGTDDGLNRFDGIGFTGYKFSDIINETTSNSVRKLTIDRRDRMWIGLDNGIVIYHSPSGQFEQFTARTEDGDEIDSYITDIMEDRDGEVWISTNGDGVYRYTPGHTPALVRYTHQPGQDAGLSQNRILSSCEDSKGNIWFGTYSEGLCRLDKRTGKFRTFRNDGSEGCLPSNSIQDVFEDSHGDLWVGTAQDGICLFNQDSGTFSRYDDLSSDRMLYHIHDIGEQRPGMLLVASDNGVVYFDTKEKHVIRTDDRSLPLRFRSNKFIYSMYIDREESLWLGSYFSGIEFVSPFQNNFKYYGCSSPLSKSGKVINSIVEDSDGMYWIATDDDGIFRFDSIRGRTIPFHTAADIGSTYYCVHDLLLDNGKLYAGTFERGLEEFDLGTGEKKSYLPSSDSTSILSSKIFKLYRSSDGKIYAGTSDGLCMFLPQEGTFRRIGPFRRKVQAIIEDQEGTIWAGSETEGLMAYDSRTGHIREYGYSESRDSLIKNNITTLAIDNRKQLWIGTYGQGLCCYNDTTDSFTRYTGLDLPNRIISSIIPQGSDLWISTNKGLSVFNPGEMTLHSYTRSNGLYNEQFTPGAGMETGNGDIMLGAADGFCVFRPQNMKENPYRAPVALTSIEIMDETFPVTGDTIRLSHRQSMIGISFAVLSYTAPEENKYRYMLEGVDSDWRESKGKNNHVSYTNLSPGKYRFLLTGTNGDQIKGSNPVSLVIEIAPPFYRSVYAYIIYGLLLASGGYFAINTSIRKNRLRQEEQLTRLSVQKEKELYESKIDFFTNIAHEIRTPLSLIIGPMEHLMQTTDIEDKYGEYLTIIEQNYRRLYSLVNQLLDFRKVDSGSYSFNWQRLRISDIIRKVCTIFQMSIEQKKLRLDLSGVSEDYMMVADEEALTKIISNLLSNAIKHARNTISVSCTEQAGRTCIRVTDDGEGIPAEEREKIFKAFYQKKGTNPANRTGIGIGLHTTYTLVELMGGEISAIDREDGQQGACIRVCLPEHADDILPEPDTECVAGTEERREPGTDSRLHTILLVDDNTEILNFLSKALSSGYFVISACSGQEALQILENNSVDLIISDVIMGNMDGYELCRKVKGDLIMSHIPVILLTAKTDTGSKVQGLEAGADSYIEKPFAISHLTAQIQNLLKKKEATQQAYSSNPLTELNAISHNKVDREFTDRCIDIILKNLENPDFSVNLLASELNMSRTSVFTKIKNITGMTPNDFIKVTRLKMAARMILEGKYKISEISFLTGFSSASYFAKCFSKQFGMNPNEFQKKMADQPS